MVSSGFTVNNQDRNDVVAFWHAVYQASEGYEKRVGWTGNYKGVPGKTASVFVDDVERRLNYFRAMCGVPANAQLNTGSRVKIDLTDPPSNLPDPSILKSVAAQQAALMLVRNFNPSTGVNLAITHNPASSLIGWSPSAWNASAKGNFSFGLYGPGAVTEYMMENLTNGSNISSWNSDVGHRRWCVFPPATDYATGDQPGTSALQPPSNVLYVMQNPQEYAVVPDEHFVSYPPAGFFPAFLNSKFWSVSRANADFTSATVTMKTTSGVVIPVSNIKTRVGFGDPAIVWEVSPQVAIRTVAQDMTFHVQVDGIVVAGSPSSYEFEVTLIDPDRLTSDQKIAGPSKASASGSTIFKFTRPPGAESLQVAAFRRGAANWVENAESGTKSLLIDDTGDNYPLIAAMNAYPGFGVLSGQKAFHLTFSTSYDLVARGVTEQSFEIDRNVVPNAQAKLNFLFRRGFMTKASHLVVETSSDDGLSWRKLGNPINGVSDTVYDSKVSKVSMVIPKSSNPIRIRFRYYTTGGGIYTHQATLPTGIFIDDISCTNCDWLERIKQNPVPKASSQFVFNKTTAGANLLNKANWFLRLETKLGGKWFNGPVTPVVIGLP